MPTRKKISRRAFLAGCAALGAGLGAAATRFFGEGGRDIPSTLHGASAARGHALWKRGFPAPTREERTGIVIVGGGIAGLSAAWRLEKRGFSDLRVLELEDRAGGNSLSGANEVSAYPWGAHYVPPLGPEAVHARELFEELGVIEGYDGRGRPRYNEFFLCASPQERLFRHGRWQDGLLPLVGASETDRAQYDAFFRRMEELKRARGSDGRRAFAIPVDSSSRDPKFTALDRITMAKFLDDNGFTSEPLRWYVDYCCRDDYGTRIDEVSAWAGVHYFASRLFEAANVDEYTVLTWPEGNGWLANRLAEKVRDHLVTGAVAFDVAPAPDGGVLVDYLDTRTGIATRVAAKAAIVASPRFVAGRIVRPLREAPPSYLKAFHYAPWVVANLTLERKPQGNGAALAWDNVLYGTEGLGYCVATHQNISRYPSPRTVVTYYRPLTHLPPDAARREALATSAPSWTDAILAELEVAHPGLRDDVARSDIWVWGHGMVRPEPGFLWGEARREAQKPLGPIHFAHSDLSGMSIFEEAHYRGVSAADAALSQKSVREGLG